VVESPSTRQERGSTQLLDVLLNDSGHNPTGTAEICPETIMGGGRWQ
jgi:hypothetical protein